MKSKKLFINLIIVLATILNWACQDKVYQTYEANVPIYMSYDDLRQAVKSTTSQEFSQPGKIYVKDNYIYINEYLKGIHIIDNSTPSAPKIIAFIEIPGNIDLAIKDNLLYADSYIDLVKIDISDPNNVKEMGRIEDLFPYTLPPANDEYPTDNIDYNKGVVIDWELKKVTNEVQIPNYPIYYDYALETASFDANSGNSGLSNTVGTGGSMARFAATTKALYTVSSYQLTTIDINNENFMITNQEYIGWDIETIFPYEDKLFFGTQSGMEIYDISIPLAPKYITEYQHIRSCDPVVVKDTLAYVTLRTGVICTGTVNRLDVVNLSKIEEPNLVYSVSMVNPHGLGVADSLLFVCDGTAGLKIYNVSKPLELDQHKIAEFSDIFAYDAIPLNNILMLIGEDGLVQYDYSDPTNIQKISEISLN